MQVSEYFSDGQRCIEFLKAVRWGGNVKCTFCKHDKVYELKGKNKRFKCAKCKKQFSITKGTIFENSPIPLQKWFIAIYLFISRKKGISSIQLSKDISVTQKTAWFLLQRIRFMLKESKLEQKLKGTILLDESYVGGKNKNRHPDKKVKNSQGRSYKDKTPVFGMLQQEISIKEARPHKLDPSKIVMQKTIIQPGKLYCKVVTNTRAKTIRPLILQNIELGCTLVTDEWSAYDNLSGLYDHHIVNHKMKQYSNNGYSSNGVENAWSHLKRTIFGTYHKTSRKHLHRYVAEFEFRYNYRNLTTEGMMLQSLTHLERRLTWKMLIGKDAKNCFVSE